MKIPERVPRCMRSTLPALMLTVLAGCSGLPSVGPDYRGPPPERSIALGQSSAPVKVEADRVWVQVPQA